MKLAVEVRDGVVQEIVASSSSKAPPPSSAARAGADPHAGSHNVAPTATEAIRIAGKKEILPDPETQNAISVSGNNRRVGSFKLCINAHGTIKNVTMLSSTGSMAYDRKIERSIYGWRYRPFMVDGEPTPVCTAVTFIYTQQDGPNHRRPARR
jgi:protein TonB